MAHFQTQIKAGRETLKLAVEVDKRLRTTARWVLHGDTITLRVPTTMTRDQINQIIEDIAPRIARQRKRAVKQSDTGLTDRAQVLNTQYFNNELTWHSIRWVKNMDRRLGSCTTGGTTDGDIRISERNRPLA